MLRARSVASLVDELREQPTEPGDMRPESSLATYYVLAVDFSTFESSED